MMKKNIYSTAASHSFDMVKRTTAFFKSKQPLESCETQCIASN